MEDFINEILPALECLANEDDRENSPEVQPMQEGSPPPGPMMRPPGPLMGPPGHMGTGPMGPGHMGPAYMGLAYMDPHSILPVGSWTRQHRQLTPKLELR